MRRKREEDEEFGEGGDDEEDECMPDSFKYPPPPLAAAPRVHGDVGRVRRWRGRLPSQVPPARPQVAAEALMDKRSRTLVAHESAPWGMGGVWDEEGAGDEKGMVTVETLGEEEAGARMRTNGGGSGGARAEEEAGARMRTNGGGWDADWRRVEV